MTEEERKNFLRKAKTRKRLGLKPGTSEGPAGRSGDPNKKLQTLEQIMGSLPKGVEAGASSALAKIFAELKKEMPNKRINQDDLLRRFADTNPMRPLGKPKPKLMSPVDIPDRKVPPGEKPNMLDVAGGAKTLNVKKGGLIKKKKKSKVAGRLAKRGYGAARK